MGKRDKAIKASEVIGEALFSADGKLILPKKRTAEEILKDLPSNPRLEREIAMIEKNYNERVNKETPHKVNKKIIAESILKEICKSSDISTHFSSGQSVIKYKNKTICWISDRKYGIAISVWGKGGEGFKTIRIVNETEMKDMIKKIKGGII
jgi:hypothetical protein